MKIRRHNILEKILISDGIQEVDKFCLVNDSLLRNRIMKKKKKNKCKKPITFLIWKW